MVELLVAMSLFAVALTALTGVFISSAKSIGDQRLRTAATRVATDHLETLRGLPFDELDDEAGQTTRTTPDGRQFTIDTAVTLIDAGTGAPPAAGATGRVKQITAVVTWAVGGVARTTSYSTAVADMGAATEQAIGTVTMFPSPATTDASGRPLEDVEVTVPLEGFPIGTLVHLSWANADGTAGAKALTSTTVQNWRGTIAKEQLLATLAADGRGEVQFRVSAGDLSAVYGLSVQKSAASQPVITSATIDRSPITVTAANAGRTCDDRNQCQNTTDVKFAVAVEGLDPTEDSVILQYQLYDGTFQEVPLAPVAAEWRLTARQKTTKYLPGVNRAFRLTAIRSADGATAATTVWRDVLST